MKKPETNDSVNASQQIDHYINGLGDWRAKMIARWRKLILEAAPELAEECSNSKSKKRRENVVRF